MEKMTRTYQNLQDFANELKQKNGKKTEFMRKMMNEFDLSIGTVRNYLSLDSKTDNHLILKWLSDETGISEENLFKRHKNDEQ